MIERIQALRALQSQAFAAGADVENDEGAYNIAQDAYVTAMGIFRADFGSDAALVFTIMSLLTINEGN